MGPSNHRRLLTFTLVSLGLAPAAFPALAAPPVAPGKAARPPAPLTCTPVPGLDPLLKPQTMLLFGEMHGTAESPAFFANTVCHALADGLSVTVVLEIPVEEDASYQAFLASEGTAADRAALLAGPFWRRDDQDGRSSEAMLGLLETLRRFEHDRRPVRVALLDHREHGTSEERDRALAARLQEIVAASSSDLVLSLTGNVHNRLAKGVPWSQEYEPMAFLVASKATGKKLISLDVAYTGGTAWTCQNTDCKARPLKGVPAEGAPKVVMHDGIDKNGYSGVYLVGQVSASAPAAAAPGAPAAPPH